MLISLTIISRIIESSTSNLRVYLDVRSRLSLPAVHRQKTCLTVSGFHFFLRIPNTFEWFTEWPRLRAKVSQIFPSYCLFSLFSICFLCLPSYFCLWNSRFSSNACFLHHFFVLSIILRPCWWKISLRPLLKLNFSTWSLKYGVDFFTKTVHELEFLSNKEAMIGIRIKISSQAEINEKIWFFCQIKKKLEIQHYVSRNFFHCLLI